MDGFVCTLPVFIQTFSMHMAACGQRHALFLTVSGTVFACGDNYCGALGLGMHPATPATYSYSPTSWYYETRVIGLPSDNVVSVSAFIMSSKEPRARGRHCHGLVPAASICRVINKKQTRGGVSSFIERRVN